jgi:hypothetical protein
VQAGKGHPRNAKTPSPERFVGNIESRLEQALSHVVEAELQPMLLWLVSECSQDRFCYALRGY